MTATTGPQTFASYLTCCDRCGVEVQTFYVDIRGETRNHPCSHHATVKLVPNPRATMGNG